MHQQHQHISSISASAASAHQQHQRNSSISAPAASVHQLQALEKISAHIHQVRSYQSISINITRRAPDTTRHAPDTTRHHQTWSRHHQIPPHMHHVWFVWSKTSYSGDKWRCHWCGRTDKRTNEQTTSKYRATQLLIWEPLSFAIMIRAAFQIYP